MKGEGATPSPDQDGGLRAAVFFGVAIFGERAPSRNDRMSAVTYRHRNRRKPSMESSHGMYTRKGIMSCNSDMTYGPVASFIKEMKPGSYVGLEQKSGNHVVNLYEISAKDAKGYKSSKLPGVKQGFEMKVANANTYLAGLMRKAAPGEVPDFIQISRAPLPRVDDWGDRKDGSKVRVSEEDVTQVKSHAIVSPANRLVIGTGGATKAIQKAGSDHFNYKLRMSAAQFELLTGRPFATGDSMLVTDDDASTGLATNKVIVTVGPDARKDKKGVSQGNRDLLKDTYRGLFELGIEHGLDSIAIPTISARTFGFGALAGEIAARESALAAVRHPPLQVTLMAHDKDVLDEIKQTLGT